MYLLLLSKHFYATQVIFTFWFHEFDICVVIFFSFTRRVVLNKNLIRKCALLSRHPFNNALTAQ